MAFTIASDLPANSPMANRTRNRRALSTIQAPNVVLQNPSSPFSPAKPPMKDAPHRDWEKPLQVPRMDTAEYTVETESAPDVEQTRKKGVNKTLTLAILTAVGAAVFAGIHVHKAAPATTPGRSGYSSISEWRADAAVEWRLSPDSKLLDLTFEEASAVSGITNNIPAHEYTSVDEGFRKWREEAALEWRLSTESRALHSSAGSPALLKWGSMGGIGAWREFAANRWRSAEASKDLDKTAEEASSFSLQHEPFSVSFFPEQKGQKQFLFQSTRSPFGVGPQ